LELISGLACGLVPTYVSSFKATFGLKVSAFWIVTPYSKCKLSGLLKGF
jgi:hypothetical protein